MSTYKGMKNEYACAAGHVTVTVDRDDGVTPFTIACPKCDAPGTRAQSRFYRVDQSQEPEYEWYRPESWELRGESRELRQHVKSGGLVLRKVPQLRLVGTLQHCERAECQACGGTGKARMPATYGNPSGPNADRVQPGYGCVIPCRVCLGKKVATRARLRELGYAPVQVQKD